MLRLVWEPAHRTYNRDFQVLTWQELSGRKAENLKEVGLGWINGGRKHHGFGWEKIRECGEQLFWRPEGKSGFEECGSLFQKWGKRGMKEWRWAVILDFGSFTRKELLVDLECPAEIWWGLITDRAERERWDWRGDCRRQKDNRPAYGERVRDPKTQPHCWRYQWSEMPWFPQREAENGERQEHQPRGKSSTPSGCGRTFCMWSGPQVVWRRTLHDGGFPVSDWLWRPGWKCVFPRKDHGR